ncbi:hypothetical protein HGRIS_002233 [Hohenbuehelia grisea]|uniref:PPM-type phosphatase domain-containing protein n=1 Tax=Hohenbuehelia grisea TaxID=104357 RepID=A0ABR3JKC7_9AGAR
MSGTILIPSASSTDHLEALAEVSQFGKTSLGHSEEAGTWTYRKLAEPYLTSELARQAKPHTVAFSDAVTFQPCPPHVSENQDRYLIQQWDLPDGRWTFCTVLDGHLNRYTVDYVKDRLPVGIKNTLQQAILARGRSSRMSSASISKILSDAVTGLDNALTSDFMRLVPDLTRPGRTETLPESNVRRVFDKRSSNYVAAARCLGGSTVVASLIDPQTRNLWVVNLGDCRAVLAQQDAPGTRWRGTPLVPVHNAHDQREVRRIRKEHPTEPTCVREGRVLDFLEPTRGIGDTWLKIPAAYTREVFSKISQKWIPPESLVAHAEHILTPPYVSNTPEVLHRPLSNAPGCSLLILCSDGLVDLYDTNIPHANLPSHWAGIVGQTFTTGPDNLAASLLRDALGGDDLDKVSQVLTVEMDEDRWIDDTTIIVQRLYERR